MSVRELPSGVQVLFGAELALRNHLVATFATTAEAFGYQQIIPPLFDQLDTFARGFGAALREKTYRFLDRDGSVLALRPDLTTQIAKIVATRMRTSQLPLRLRYAGEVFRYEEVRASRQREFFQLGCELFGPASAAADAEILVVALDALRALSIHDFRIVVGHVGLLRGVIDDAALDARDQDTLFKLLDRKNRGEIHSWPPLQRLRPQWRAFLEEAPFLAGDLSVLDRAATFALPAASSRALEHLREIDRLVTAFAGPAVLRFDLGEARALKYYTGMVFEVYARGQGFELGGGGRYDELLPEFGAPIQAAGFSLSSDRLVALVAQHERAHPEPSVVRLRHGREAEAFAEAGRRRAAGECVRFEI